MSFAVAIVAYLTLFAAVAFLFLLVSLLLGRLLRASDPHPEKLKTYECGEPAIGSSFVQFDLRFYVVALLFIIFAVEVALFFPWATVFGKATQLVDPGFPVVEAAASVEDGTLAFTAEARGLLDEMGATATAVPAGSEAEARADIKGAAKRLVWISVADIGVFFVVLMVGFAYVWKRGDLDWVRAVGRTSSA